MFTCNLEKNTIKIFSVGKVYSYPLLCYKLQNDIKNNKNDDGWPLQLAYNGSIAKYNLGGKGNVKSGNNQWVLEKARLLP